MKNKTATVLVVLLSIFMAVYAGFQIWNFFDDPYDTEIVSEYSIKDTIHVSGLAVRNELIIDGDAGGSISYVYDDGSKVNKNKVVAYTHGSKDTILKMDEAKELEKKISQLKEASSNVSQLYGSFEYINTEIGKSIVEYTQNVYSNNLSSFAEIKDKLLLDINKKGSLIGEENFFEERIASLEEKYNRINDEILKDESEIILAPKNGYFISSVDGFETLIDRDTLFDRKVSDLEAVINREIVQEEEKIGKISDSYKWYYIFSVSKEDSENMKGCKNVIVNFEGISNPYTLSMDSIIEDDSSNNCIVVLECKTFTSEVASLRQIDADITLHTYSGLKIPNEAIRFDAEQNSGVFIKDRDEVKFRKIDIIYATQNYSIVDIQKNKNKYLQKFDEVFVGGNELFEGKILN